MNIPCLWCRPSVLFRFVVFPSMPSCRDFVCTHGSLIRVSVSVQVVGLSEDRLEEAKGLVLLAVKSWYVSRHTLAQLDQQYTMGIGKHTSVIVPVMASSCSVR